MNTLQLTYPQRGAEVTKMGMLDMQVCVPKEFTDEEIVRFAERLYPCGTTVGWVIRRQGSKSLSGMPERNPCGTRDGFVHVMLDA